MQYFFQDNGSDDLIVFFSGWGCDENQFTNLRDAKDVLILYNYQDLKLDFDFSKYKNIYIIAYSAGVFVASITADKIPSVRKKVAVCGNPYLFDEVLGISGRTIQVFKDINLDNYLDFRRKYMVFSEEEYKKYNKLQSMRTIESCQDELVSLQKMYEQKKSLINPSFDMAVVAQNDLIFNLNEQKDFYKNNLLVIKNAKHHIFFNFNSLEDLLKI